MKPEPRNVPSELRAKLRELDGYLSGQIFGQAEAIRAFSAALRTGELELNDSGRPMSFQLFVGPTGVGKTEMALRASGFLFGSDVIARINCGEFSPESNKPIARLIGDAGDPDNREGVLGPEYDKLMRTGGKILLLDEIEKAEKKVADLFLGMEGGTIMLGSKRVLDMRKLHVIVTSNLGTAQASAMAQMGLPRTMIQETIKTECIRHFKREVLARFTGMVFFNGLSLHVVELIARKFINVVMQRLVQSPYLAGVTRLELGPGVFESIVATGTDVAQGARPMRNAVENRFQEAATRLLLNADEPPRGPHRIELSPDGQSLQIVPIAEQAVAARLLEIVQEKVAVTEGINGAHAGMVPAIAAQK